MRRCPKLESTSGDVSDPPPLFLRRLRVVIRELTPEPSHQLQHR